MLRVMQINSGELFGGVSAMVFNFYKNIDRSKIQFDFVAPKKSSYKIHEHEIKQMGGRIIELKTKGNFLKRKLQFFKRLIKLIKTNQYDVVHINSGSIFLNIQVAWIAKYCGVKKIIAHSHNSGNDHYLLALLTKLCKPLLEFGPTDYFACSNRAAQFMFTSKRIKSGKYKVINNGIDIEEFNFSNVTRKKYRSNLSIGGKVALLHVGRFTKAKNHIKLIGIFDEYHKLNPNSLLLLAGEGALKLKIKDEIEKRGLTENVIFLGLRKDVPALMDAADAFILPSLYEGLPVVGVEAQASGLPCVFSGSITDEVNLLKNRNVFVDLSKNDAEWALQINKLVLQNTHAHRKSASQLVGEKGYSLVDVAKQLEKNYLSALN